MGVVEHGGALWSSGLTRYHCDEAMREEVGSKPGSSLFRFVYSFMGTPRHASKARQILFQETR